MLVQFSIKNFKTFKNKATLSFVASNYDKDTRVSENISVDEQFNLRILKSAVVYGANASGKSKLLEALDFMKYFVLNSSRESQKGDQIKVTPFRLNEETENEPSEFEVIFTNNNVLYRYGFEVNRDVIVSEWLYYRPKTKEIELFIRDLQDFFPHKKEFHKGKTLVKEELVRDNALMLSVAAQFNDPICNEVVKWFNELNVIAGNYEFSLRDKAIQKIKSEKGKEMMLSFLQWADLGIKDLEIRKITPQNLMDMKSNPFDVVITHHDKYRGVEKIGKVDFYLNLDESEGTQKYFYILSPIIDALVNGSILVIDELDAKLHPNLVEKLVSLFNSKSFNTNDAQLIFNTQDTNLLSSGLFRRDQILFTEKNKFGEARLFSLADFKSDAVRKNELFEDNYVRGKYGAVPYLNFFEELTDKLSQYENEK